MSDTKDQWSDRTTRTGSNLAWNCLSCFTNITTGEMKVMDEENPIEIRFLREKIVSIGSDYCSSGIWDGHQVNVPVSWLPVSWYAKGLINAMQVLYDCQEIPWEGEPIPYDNEHFQAYENMQERARDQVRLELSDWEVR